MSILEAQREMRSAIMVFPSATGPMCARNSDTGAADRAYGAPV
jgi:hypothetical protein